MSSMSVHAASGSTDETAVAHACPDSRRRFADAERSQRTAQLLERAQQGTPQDQRALLAEVVELNMQVAEAVARRYAHKGIALEDLTQVAYLALVRSVSTFDAVRGGDLLSYAVPCIQGEIRHHFRDQGWTIRPPREVQRAHSLIMGGGLERDHYDDASLADLADKVDESVEVVREALAAKASYTALSLDRAFEAVEPGLPATGAEDLDAVEARAMLAPLVRLMAEHERLALRWRFVEELSQREIAERLSMTQVQVSRLLHRLLTGLRLSLGEVG